MTDIDGCISNALARKIAALRQIPLFQRCRESVQHRVAQSLHTVYGAPGEILSRAGDAVDCIFLLAFGTLQVWSHGQDIVGLCDTGVIGDPRVLLRIPVETQHNVFAKTFCQVHVLKADDFSRAAGLKVDDGRSMSEILSSLAIPWKPLGPESMSELRNPKSMNRQHSFKKAATKALRVIQFVKALNTQGRRESISTVKGKDAENEKNNEKGQEKPADTEKDKETKGEGRRRQTARLHKELSENKEKLPEQSIDEEKEAIPQKDVLVFNNEAHKMEISMQLQGLDFFSTLDTFSFERLISLFSKKFWRRNEQLLVEGKPAKAMHIVLHGDVNIIIGGKALNKLGPKSVLGERSVLSSTTGDPAPCGATVTAASPIVTTLSASRAHLQDLFSKDDALLEHFQSRFDIERVRRGVTSFRNVKLFREADPSFTQALEVAVKERVFHQGDYLLTEGLPCSEAVMLCTGTVNILSDGVKVASFTVVEMEEAMMFGEFTLLGLWACPRASVVAVETCRVQVIDSEALRRCLDLYPDESFIFRELVEARMNQIYRQEDMVRKQKSYGNLEGGSHEDPSTSPSGKEGEATGRDDVKTGEDPFAFGSAERKRIPHGICQVKDFKVLSAQCIRELETYLHKRLFIPDQVIVYYGTDLQDVYVLQQGTCEAKVFGATFESMEGPCVIGGLPSVLTKKVFTTVIATETCFVVKISQRHFNAVLEKHQDERKKLVAAANRAFSTLCDEFQQSTWIAQAFAEQLGAMPCLSGASPEFLSALAHVLEPRLLLPAQEIFLSSSDKEDGADLYFVFEGHFHCLQKGAVMGTISPKMVFGILEVFGISDVSNNMRIWSDEICKVGVLTQAKLCDLLHEYPEERGKFEKLVHNLMEDSVNHHLIALPFFSGLNNQQILTVCHLLDRRFLLPNVTIVKEGDGGDFMMVLNCGKVEVFYKDMSMGMLGSGRAFGASQMMGLHTRYHATLKAKSTCHILLIFWPMLSGLIVNAADMTWVQAMKQQAQEIYELETVTYARKLQKMSNMARSRHLLIENVEIITGLWSLRDIFLAWYQVASLGKQSVTPQATRLRQVTPRGTWTGSRGIPLPQVQGSEIIKKQKVLAPKPFRFQRNMRWVGLPADCGKKDWSRKFQSGRLDIWKGDTGPGWLHAVRKEVMQDRRPPSDLVQTIGRQRAA